MKREYFLFDGKDSRDFSCYLARSNMMLDAPKRVQEEIEIPGRNGTLIVDGGRYENMPGKATVYVTKDIVRNMTALKGWLLSETGYKRYEESTDPDVYRLAKLNDGIEVEGADHVAGYFDLNFTCKPQKYLKSGEIPIKLTSSGEILNPTRFPSKPLIEVTGTGSITIAGQLIQINKNDAGMTIDTEIMEAYYGSTSLNSDVVLPDELNLQGGRNRIVLSSGITAINIYPRWWRL